MDERESKQKFLTTEIIEKGFDSDKFMQVCESLKGTEIDDYTLEELKEIVSQFQSANSLHEAPEEPEISVPDTQIEQPKAKEHPKRPDSSAYSIEAIKMQDNDLSLEEIISVTLTQAEAVSQGLLSATKYFYPLTTQPFGWVVKRTVDDFVWIRQILTINFPGTYLPPFPPKRFKSTSEANSKQQFFLERFINCILRNPLLRRSTYLQSFLMDSDPKVFSETKKKSTKEKKMTRLEEFWTLDGTIICDPFNDETEKATINEYLNVVEAMKKKIKRQTDVAIGAFKELSNHLLEISKSYEILENIQSYVPEITGTKPLYNCLKNSFFFWAEHELKCADMLKDHFNMFFKYGYTEIMPLRELIKEKEYRFDLFDKAKARLLAKKEKLWSSGDANKWGLSSEDMWNASALKNDKILAFSKMLKKETAETDKLKDEFAFYNFQTKSEIRRFLLDNQLLENLHFTSFARSMCTQTTNIHVNWGELIANLSRIRSENIPSRSFISKNLKN